jgi:hypothetical protein
MSHTPKPWKAKFYGDNSCDIYAGDKLIAELEYPDGDECDADGLLIAAAPELLEAARIALSMMGGDDSGPDDDEIHDEWERVRAAIRKATIRYPD